LTTVRERRASTLLIKVKPELLVELCPAILIKRSAKAPNKSEEEETLNGRIDVGGLHFLHLVSSKQLIKHCLKEPKQRCYQSLLLESHGLIEKLGDEAKARRQQPVAEGSDRHFDMISV
jgi:hypothetical protein